LAGELEAHSAAVGVGDLVDFLGHVERIEDVYGNARVFVLMSAGEGLPIAMLDAMAAGLPVVATAVDEIGRVIEPGRNGLLYDVGDVPALADRIEALLANPKVATRLAAAAQVDVNRDYGVDSVALAYRRVFASVGSA